MRSVYCMKKVATLLALILPVLDPFSSPSTGSSPTYYCILVDRKAGVYLLGQAANTLYTYGSIWQLEAENEGGIVGYAMPVRIRLLHHDLYLTLLTNGKATNPGVASAGLSDRTTTADPNPLYSSAGSLGSNGGNTNVSDDVWLTLTSVATKDTLFVMHAVRSHHHAANADAAAHTQIPYGNYVRIQHSRSRRWIHCVDVFKQSPSHMMVGWKYREVVASKAFDHNNIFLIQSVPQVRHVLPLPFPPYWSYPFIRNM